MHVQNTGTREINEPLVCGCVKANGERGKKKSKLPPYFSPPWLFHRLSSGKSQRPGLIGGDGSS